MTFWPESVQSKLNEYIEGDITNHFDTAHTLNERKCPKGSKEKYLYPEKLCRDHFEFLEEEDDEGRKNIKIKVDTYKDFFYSPESRKLNENQFCMDMETENDPRGFRIGYCKKIEEGGMQFK